MKIDNLHKSFASKHAVNGININLQKSRIHGLLGTNGAGKSTFIKCLLGLTRFNSGEISFDSEDGYLSYLPEIPHLPMDLTALQIVRFSCRLRGQSSSIADELLSEVGLSKEYHDKKIRTYSKGMRQRVALAYCLSGEPDWLILDEPMSGLDVLGRKHILEIISQRKQAGMGVFMCSHVVTDMVRVCDHIHIMAAGKICESIELTEHTIKEAEQLESRLEHWNRQP